MTKKQSNPRINPSPQVKLILFDEVDGICPKCTNPLQVIKGNKYVNHFDVAHIYPLNPTKEEAIILKNAYRLSSDVNSINNLIAICKLCHKTFDTYKTIDEYNEYVDLKKFNKKKRK